MLSEYVKMPRKIVPGIHQWIQGEIRNDEQKSIRTKAFNELLDSIWGGKNLINAIRDIQDEYEMPITYDTILPNDTNDMSTLVIKVG